MIEKLYYSPDTTKIINGVVDCLELLNVIHRICIYVNDMNML